MKLFNLILLVTIQLIMTACGQISSEDINQDKIYTKYKVTYDEENRKLNFSAGFIAGGSIGTQVWLDGESEIFFNGEKLKGRDDLFNVVRYEKIISNTSLENLSRSHKIEYLNEDGESFQNSFTMPEKVLVSDTRYDEVQNEVILFWVIDDTKLGDYLTVSLYDEEDKVIYREMKMTGRSGKLELNLSDIELSSLNLKYKICRSRYTSNIIAPEQGGSLNLMTCHKKRRLSL